MQEGKMNLTLGEIQGNLRQVLEQSNMTPEQRYSISAAIQTVDFLRSLSPGLKKAINEYRHVKAVGTAPGRIETSA